MAGNKVIKSKKKVSLKSKLKARKPQRGGGANRQSNRRLGFGSLVANGARTLISTIPGVGSFLDKIADFAFKAIGLTSSLSTETTKLAAAETNLVGLSAEIIIPISTVWSNSNLATIDDGSNLYRPTVTSQYNSVRLLEVGFKLIPASKLQDRQGEWAMCFIPFRSANDLIEFKNSDHKNVIPSYNAVSRKAGAVFGSGANPLQLVYHPRGNVYLQQFHTEDTFFGVLMIGYQDTLRDRPIAFTAAEVAPEVIVTGKVMAGNQTSSGVEIIATGIWDNLSANAMAIVNQESGYTAALISDADFKCKEDGKKCLVTGNVFHYPKESRQERLARERAFIQLSAMEV